MTNLKRAITWAVAILFVAGAKRFGFMNARAAEALLLVLPILAVMAIAQGRKAGAGEPVA